MLNSFFTRIGRGIKACPFVDADIVSQVHTSATRKLLQDRLARDRAERLEFSSPTRDVFIKTSAYISAIRKRGCSSPVFEITQALPLEQEERSRTHEHYSKIRRGYSPPHGLCQGRLEFDYMTSGKPCIRQVFQNTHDPCEHRF